MSNPKDQAQSLFLNALEIDNEGARAAFLASECQGDEGLRKDVEELLEHAHRLGRFMENREEAGNATCLYPNIGQAGDVIGPYKLLQQIGEGGMGTVFMAEQTEPVERRVALKIIKPGMDTQQVIARFEAERQALAMMDHPNIAKVLDAGTTNAGRPFFVMELVKGLPITQYCDEQHLSPRGRLELFIPICQAVQHAHQKGIIHRDLKPSNILIARYDDKPVPKVIDFGVAKATSQKLTEKTMFTQYGQLVGTIDYMSPEQAQFNQLDVDTRSDIYSLGVLLYELLTGETPFDRTRLRSAAFEELLRIIREEEPPRPSVRLSSCETLASVAANRHMDPHKLGLLVRGELDWIVMKALEKNRSRRYETANAFAGDVQRYLADEPVQACPPSAVYCFRKFVRRNKGPVGAAFLVSLALIAGMIGTTIGLIQAEKARQAEAEQRQLAESNEQKALSAAAAEKKAKETAEDLEAETRAVLDFVENKVFAAAGPEGEQGGLGREVTLRNAIEAALPFVESSFPKQPTIEARLRSTLGIAYLNLGEAAKAAEQFQKAQDLSTQHLGPKHPDTLTSMANLASGYAALGRFTDAFKLRQETLTLRKASLGLEHSDTLTSMNQLASSYRDLGRYTDALRLNEQTLALRKATLGPDHPQTLTSMACVATNYEDHDRNAEALKLREVTLALMKVKFGRRHSTTLMTMNNLANSYDHLGQYADALKLRQETLEICKKKLGPDHPFTLMVMYNLAHSYTELSQHADALKLYEETLVLYRTKLGSDHPDTIRTMGALAGAHESLGRYTDALKFSQETLALSEVKLGPDHPQTLLTMWRVTRSLYQLSRGAEADVIIDECLKRAEGKVIHPRLIIGLKTLQIIPRVRHFEKTNDAAGCRATAETFETLQLIDDDDLYHAACFRAITATVIKRDPKTPAADASRLTMVEADRAMVWLTQAVAAGFNDVPLMKGDNALDALRDRPDFQQLVADLELELKTNAE